MVRLETQNMTATSSIVQNSFSTGADWLGRSATISGVSALAISHPPTKLARLICVQGK